MSDSPNLPLRVLSLACLTLITGCTMTQQSRVPAALDFPRSGDQRSTGDLGEQQRIEGPRNTVISSSPKPPAPIAGNLRPIPARAAPDEKPGDLSVSFEQMALPAFIQAVYGGILKLNYAMDPAVSARTELITFRTPKPMTAARLTEVSAQLLRSYGVAVQDFGGVLRMVPDSNTNSTLPLVRRGRAQPTVPLPLRPIFHYVETESVRPSTFIGLLKNILGSKVTVESDVNNILLSGQPDDVAVALELIQVFDQPGLRAQNSVRIVPRYWGAEEFARRLSEVLRAEGYGIGNQPNSGEPITVMAIAPVNSVLLFATNKDIITHILDWVRELDQLPTIQAGSAYFTYPVKHADAQELARSLNDLIGGTTTPAAATGVGTPASTGAAPAGAAAATSPARSRRVVVNNATNSLIFQGGSQEDYRQWLSLLSELDKPVKSALIDVLVAEVALDDSNNLGFQWQLNQLGGGDAISLSGTKYGVAAGSNGFGVTALLGGNPLRSLVINALASNSDSRVMSNPKVMTRNGESASISVGQDVPIVTSQGVTQNSGILGGTSNVVPQTVQYRNTGVILRVRPVIHAGDRIDLDISQEVSSALPTSTGVSSSPTISRRSVETKLSLRDGATVMLGGLISESNTDSNTGVPGLKDVPFLGNLFRSKGKTRGRTELVILITPYILNDSADAEAATDAFNGSLGEWADSVRGRIDAGRLNRKLRIESENRSLNEAKPPELARPAPVLPNGVGEQRPAPNLPVLPSVPNTELQPNSQAPAGARMINLGNATGAADSTSTAPVGQTTGNPTDAAPTGLPQTIPAGRSAAPAVINGVNVPAGATVVDDPKLKQELLNLIRK
jgi:general secretion pathway protein D